MDISAYLASVQDNPQSAMLARNVMQPGIPSPSGENAPDAGIPQPNWSDQSQQDTEPVTGGFDQAQMGMDAPTPAPMQDIGASQQDYAPPQMGMSALDAGGSSAEDFTGSSYGDSNEGYARGGMVSRAPRLPRLPKSAGRGSAGRGGPGLFSPSTRKGGPGEDPSTFQPKGSISDIGMYDASGNLKGITDIGITKNEIYGNPNFRHNDVANGEARGDNFYGVGGPAGDSSGGDSSSSLPMGAEGGSVDEMVELSNGKGDDRYSRPPSSENVDDRRGKDSLDMNWAQAADVTGAPLGYGMLKGTPYRQAKADHDVAPKRPLLWDDPANDLASTSRPVPKYADGGTINPAQTLYKKHTKYDNLPEPSKIEDRRRENDDMPNDEDGPYLPQQLKKLDDTITDEFNLAKPIMKFDEGGSPDDIEQTSPAIPPPVENTERGEEMSGEMDQEKPMGSRERMGAAIGMHGRGLQEAVAAGFKEIYNQAGVNTGVPTPQGEQGARAMMQGKGATPAPQAEAAIEANGGNSGKAVEAVYNFFNAGKDASKDLTALHDYASDKIDPNPTPGYGRSDFEEMGPQAAAGMLQHLRVKFNQSAALGAAAADQGNMAKAAEACQVALDKCIPDGKRVQVTPNQGGVNVNIDGQNTPLTTQQLHHVLATPFDVIAHMGVPQTIANLQNVQQLQHPSGQPQQPTTQPANVAPQPLPPPKQQVPTTGGPTANMQQVEAAKARMAQQDMQQGLNSDGTPRGTGGANNSNGDDELPTNAYPTAGRAPRAPAAPKTPAAARPRPNMKYTDDEAARAGRGLDRSGNPIEYTLQKPLTNQEKQGLTDVERYGDVSPEAMNRQRGNDQQLLMGAVNDRNKRLGTTADPVGGAAGLHSTWERNAAASAKLEFEAIKDPKPGDQERITQKWRDFWYKKQQQGGPGGSPPQTQGNQPQTQVKDGVTWTKVNGGWQRAQ